MLAKSLEILPDDFQLDSNEIPSAVDESISYPTTVEPPPPSEISGGALRNETITNEDSATVTEQQDGPVIEESEEEKERLDYFCELAGCDRATARAFVEVIYFLTY
jgi:hypothetical protein